MTTDGTQGPVSASGKAGATVLKAAVVSLWVAACWSLMGVYRGHELERVVTCQLVAACGGVLVWVIHRITSGRRNGLYLAGLPAMSTAIPEELSVQRALISCLVLLPIVALYGSFEARVPPADRPAG